MTYRYVPAQEEMAKAMDWLRSIEGRIWQDRTRHAIADSGDGEPSTVMDSYGMNNGKWICLKEDAEGGSDTWVAWVSPITEWRKW